MSAQPLTINLPEATIRTLRRAAELTFRSMDDVVLNALNVIFTAPPNLPPELGSEFAAMHSLSDEALQTASTSALSPAQQGRLNQLSHAGGERNLTPAEHAELASLLNLYDQSVLRRAQALAILAFRGHPMPTRADWQHSVDDDENI